ncbi:MAG: hypothetical protein JW982_14065 [Spirochaetes bacterium]|nr:hypothetical protein [Spirochaetota bacterium]
MKIVHVLKKIETIDADIKELRKLEKSLQKDKSFSTPIYMTIEKQVSLLVGERVKLLELQVKNPPEFLTDEFKDDEKDVVIPTPLKKNKKSEVKSKSAKKNDSAKPAKINEDFDDLPIQMLTQDAIDSKFDTIKNERANEISRKTPSYLIKEDEDEDTDEISDENVKLLDIALNKGTIKKEDVVKEKKRVKFFRDNFPGNEY